MVLSSREPLPVFLKIPLSPWEIIFPVTLQKNGLQIWNQHLWLPLNPSKPENEKFLQLFFHILHKTWNCQELPTHTILFKDNKFCSPRKRNLHSVFCIHRMEEVFPIIKTAAFVPHVIRCCCVGWWTHCSSYSSISNILVALFDLQSSSTRT